MIEHDPCISQFEHERARPREAEALQTLKKVASIVKPIMRQRGWHVGILTEFWPTEKSLLGLNWNQGQKICLRLRYPHDERQFLPLEDVVDTMLHELSHIVHGPHDEKFYTLWNQLRSEHDALVRKGYTGEGFLSTGHKLGGRRIPMNEARRRARVAAEKRKTLSAGSGQKLGGAPVRRGADIRKVIADAASRRTTITNGCASGTERSKDIVEETSKNGFRTKAEDDDADEVAIMQAYIELIQEDEREKYGDAYLPPSSTNPSGSGGQHDLPGTSASPTSIIGRAKPSRHKPQTLIRGENIDLSDVNTELKPSRASTLPAQWSCEVCTLINPIELLSCDACDTERAPQSTLNDCSLGSTPNSANNPSTPKTSRPTDKAAKKKDTVRKISSLAAAERAKPIGWLCQNCRTFMENQWWTCSTCGQMKQSS